MKLNQKIWPTFKAQWKKFTIWIIEKQKSEYGQQNYLQQRDRFVYRQRFRIWGLKISRMTFEKKVHPKHVIVWRALWP